METLETILVRFGPLAAALAGTLVAALANGVETGIYRLNRIRLRLRAGRGDRRARALVGLLTDVRGLIIVCLVVYNAGVYVAAAIVTNLVAHAGWAEGPVGVEILATVILAPLFLIFTDVLPKSLFTYEADRWMVRFGGVLRGAYGLLNGLGLLPALKGVSALVLRVAHGRAGARANPFHPRQRLRAFLREGAAEGVITGYQDELVERVLALRERQVQDVMIVLARVTSVEVSTDRERFLSHLRAHSYSRVPVWEGRSDHIVGIVHINDVLAAGPEEFDLARLAVPEPLRVTPDMPVSQAMFRMRAARAAMAVVVGPRDRALGIITIKDLVEEIVGELAVW